MKPYKPAGHSSVSPYLLVNGASDVIDFLKRVFGAVELLRMEREPGVIKHAEVRIDDSVIMLGDALKDWPAVPSHVHIYVPDVDETYRLALEAGATSVQAPFKGDDCDKRGGFKDPGGTTWWVGTKMN
jgi:uncharacterized glyoxalase superfamily protein PhnB